MKTDELRALLPSLATLEAIDDDLLSGRRPCPVSMTIRQAREFHKALDRLDAAEKDAARYRWLRDMRNQGARAKDGTGLIVCTDSPSAEFVRYVGPIFGPNLDAAIDQATASESGGCDEP